MKYLKIYESDNNKYWLVPTDSRFENSIRQVCNDEKWISSMINNSQIYIPSENINNDYIFISYGKFYYSVEWPEWGWNPLKKNKIKDKYFDKLNFKFSGYLGISKEEIEYLKLRNNVNKYNL